MTLEMKTPQSNHNDTIVKRILVLLAVALTSMVSLALLVPGPIQKSSYMGAEYCGSCHQQEYASWVMSPHARAHDVLPTESKTNVACLSCHATGVSDGKDAFLKGVQCESCHGPGQYYAALHVKKDPVLSKLVFKQNPDEASCLQCHRSGVDQWSPHEGMKKIDHWSTSSKTFHGARAQKTIGAAAHD